MHLIYCNVLSIIILLSVIRSGGRYGYLSLMFGSLCVSHGVVFVRFFSISLSLYIYVFTYT